MTTITGANFSNVVAGNIVYFGAAKAVVSAATSTSLMVIVPGGSTHEPLTVTTNNLTAYSAAPFIVTFSGGGNFTPGSFASAVNFTTGSNPYGISIEDIDGDGRSDLVTANLSSDNFSLLRNTGSIGSLSFASKIDVATGIQPVNNATGDLDGDGKRDLIAANYGSNTISVFRNTSLSGTPSFSTKTDFATGINPLSVLIRDINGDGKPDMVVTNYSSNTFSVLANTSAGTGIISFAAKVDFNTGTQPAGMEIKDFDGDGKPDVAVSNYGSNSVSVFRNTSTGGSISFAAKIDIVTGNNPNSVASCDFDGDGKFEIISANYSSNSISVFKNLSTSGAISFAAKVDYGTGSNPFKAVINDLNGDGLGDIVTANVFDATVSVLRNNGYGSSISFATSLQYATGSQPRSVGIADFDGDGEPDIAAGNYNDNTVSIVKNQIAVTLPLSLLDFTLTNKTNQIELYWKTANELNISLFTIEYSSDGLSFVKIGEVRSTHNTFSTNNYNFLHTNPDKGISYYRLKIMDIDGRFVYSKIIQAKLTAAAVQLLIFPNPSSEYIIVKHPLSPFESELQIVDMKGSVIKTIKVNKNVVQTEISTKKLPPGSYNIVWRCNETIISKKALVK